MLLVAVVAFAASDQQSASSASPDISQDVWEHQMEEAGRQGSWADLDDQIKKESLRAKDALSDFEEAFPSIQADRNAWQPVAAKPAKPAKASSFAEVGQVDDLLAPKQIALLESKSRDQVAQTWGDINAFRRQAALMKEELHRPGTTIAGAIARVRAEMGTSFIELGDAPDEPETYMGWPMDRAAMKKKEHDFREGRDEREKERMAETDANMKKATKDYADEISAMMAAAKKHDWSHYEDADLRKMEQEAKEHEAEIRKAEDDESEALARDLPESGGTSLLETPGGETEMEAELRKKQRQITLDMADDLKRIQAAERKARGAVVPSQLELSLIASKEHEPGDGSQAAAAGEEKESEDNKAMREEKEREAKADEDEEECSNGDKKACGGSETEKTAEEEEKKEEKMVECDQEGEENKDCAAEEDKKDGVANEKKEKELEEAEDIEKKEAEEAECEAEDGSNCDQKGVKVEKTKAQQEEDEGLAVVQAEEKKEQKEAAQQEEDEKDGAPVAEEMAENEADEEKKRAEDASETAEQEADLDAEMAAKAEDDEKDREETEVEEAELKANADGGGDEDPDRQTEIKTTGEEDLTTGPSEDPKDKMDDRDDDGEDDDADEPGEAKEADDALNALLQQAATQHEPEDGGDVMAAHITNALRDMQTNKAESDEAEKEDEESHHSHRSHHSHKGAHKNSEGRSSHHKKRHESEEEQVERKEADESEHDEDGVFAAENEVDKDDDASKKQEREIEGVENDIEAEARKEGKELPDGFKENFKSAAEAQPTEEEQEGLMAEDEAEAKREAAEEREVDTEAEEANADEASDGSPDIDMDPMAQKDAEEDRAARDSLLQTEPLPTGQIYKPVATQMRGIDDLDRATAGLRQFAQHVGQDFDEAPPPTQEATRSGADLLDDALSDLRREDH